MNFRMVPKSVTLNGAIAVTLRYFTEFGPHHLGHSKNYWTVPRRSVAEFMHESIVSCTACTMSS